MDEANEGITLKAEVERLRAQIASMSSDMRVLITAVMYGDPPVGWNNVRGAEFSAEVQAVIARQQDRIDPEARL